MTIIKSRREVLASRRVYRLKMCPGTLRVTGIRDDTLLMRLVIELFQRALCLVLQMDGLVPSDNSSASICRF